MLFCHTRVCVRLSRWQQQCDHRRKNAAVGRTRPGDRRVAGGLRVVVDHHILLIEGQGAI